MTRADVIRRIVIRGICDDYEDIERIANWTVPMGSKCGLTVTHHDIIQALHELIEFGHAKGYDLEYCADPPTESQQQVITPINPSFSRTEEGLAYQLANLAIGPFDEDRNLRESWPPPELSIPPDDLARLFILGSFQKGVGLRLWFIEHNWKTLSERNGIAIPRDEFIQGFRELVALGYLKTRYKDEGWQYDGMPPLEDIKPFGAYFWVTDAGWDFYEARDSGGRSIGVTTRVSLSCGRIGLRLKPDVASRGLQSGSSRRTSGQLTSARAANDRFSWPRSVVRMRSRRTRIPVGVMPSLRAISSAEYPSRLCSSNARSRFEHRSSSRRISMASTSRVYAALVSSISV